MKKIIFLFSIFFGVNAFAQETPTHRVLEGGKPVLESDKKMCERPFMQSKQECLKNLELSRLESLAACRYLVLNNKKKIHPDCQIAEQEQKRAHLAEVQKCKQQIAPAPTGYGCEAYAATLTGEGKNNVDTCADPGDGTWEKNRGVGQVGMYSGKMSIEGSKDVLDFAAKCGIEGGKDFANETWESVKGVGHAAASGYNWVSDRINGVPRAVKPTDNRTLAEKIKDGAKGGQDAAAEAFAKLKIKFQCYTPRAQQEMICIAAASKVVEGAAMAAGFGALGKLCKVAGVTMPEVKLLKEVEGAGFIERKLVKSVNEGMGTVRGVSENILKVGGAAKGEPGTIEIEPGKP